jgi:hypothetical protein
MSRQNRLARQGVRTKRRASQKPAFAKQEESMLDIALSSASVKVDRLDGPTYYPNEAVVRAGQEAWCRLRSNATWDDWKQVGKAHVIGRHKAMIEAGANRPIGRRYIEAFSTWQREFGFDNLDKGDRARLFEVMGHLAKIEAWLATLTTSERLRLNHPTTLLRRWKAATVILAPKLSSQTKMKATNIELQEELHRLKRNGDGSVFTKNDSAKGIATAIIGTFDGLSNKAARVEAIARELAAWVKQQKMAAQ